MLLIVDYGMGNLCSIEKALQKLGVEYIISYKREDFEKATHIILPGVGYFREGMKNLIERNIPELLAIEVLKKKKPLLGICLGMQLLFESSTEGGYCKGLDLIRGRVDKFKYTTLKSLKLPHVGWNNVFFENSSDNLLFKDIPNNSDFYFVHSYHVIIEDVLKNNISYAITNYGYDFVSVVNKENIFGVQFHPEKSQKYGLKLIENFIKFGVD